ncbi:MAG: 5-(carboxyamino)imidazole ribonucleotide synthase [Verrucomicrobiae bacterium]
MHETYDSEIKKLAAPKNFPVRLGIIGGGQLARMTAIAALPLGCEVVVLEQNEFSPAARLSPDCIIGDWSDEDTLRRFAQSCDVVTLENEFVDAAALKVLEKEGHKVFPESACIAVTQDKFKQKSALQAAGLAVPNFRAVNSREEILSAAKDFGWPLLLKTRRNGYDGKGNFTLKSEADVATGWSALGGDKNELMVEAWFPFVKELAVIVTRGRDGQIVTYPVVETIQRNHVCHVVKAPAEISSYQATYVLAMARRAVEAVGGVGSFGVEMFLAADGEIVINELAPRVHNSGHYTIEACDCSQFENHVRAVLGWPLGNPLMLAPAAVMVNLLGTEKSTGQPRGLETVLRMTGTRVHIYGKMMSGAGRKMGHITVLENSLEEAQAIAERAAKEIYFGNKL